MIRTGLKAASLLLAMVTTTAICPATAFFSSSHISVLNTVSHDTVTWEPPRFSERQKERNALVTLLKQQGIESEQVLEAMRHVPRHLFVPKTQQPNAYRNTPLPIGHQQTISQPYVVAFMTELLDIQPGEKVLEIGTGSGYQAAVLSELTPKVYTIEIIPELGQRARRTFSKLGYSTIQTKIGDGYKGWPGHAPFDAVIITAAAPKIPQPLIDQLRPGGALVMPHGEPNGSQILIRVTKTQDGDIKREKILPVRFVPMTGDVQGN
ncbi:protein-L-isoaspartate(D-aspartate) O-methyltransferase [Aliifodinibius sp. S!AR15-10]|uniref:protein-L-isoaspartate(D-aspartate) O-methyltransferase n=1 Tax=Aliifodinibius sp. S!AR15-10 TaxID=2950437 RepID=UPI002859A721|nr:protein-L-isoaspartate(D-aspartate) O-methyltransferase [Aliifodinibius sp. S!AR15-10]MDR8394476.1 protein-L-isoaspartate(D-aspartate) O-methyltransferase [Aliifodinibius sp. S!AR15-10]